MARNKNVIFGKKCECGNTVWTKEMDLDDNDNIIYNLKCTNCFATRPFKKRKPRSDSLQAMTQRYFELATDKKTKKNSDKLMDAWKAKKIGYVDYLDWNPHDNPYAKMIMDHVEGKKKLDQKTMKAYLKGYEKFLKDLDEYVKGLK